MKRPALTRKAINNLISLWGYAEVEIADNTNPSNAIGDDCKDALAAIEWIKRANNWKAEQEDKKKNLDPSWVKACKADGVDPLSKFVVFSEDNPEVATWSKED